MLCDANNDSTLLAERRAAKDLCHTFNLLPPSDLTGRAEIIKKLLGHTEEDFLFEGPFWCDYGYNIRIGKNFYANHDLVILDGAKVVFGDHVFIGPYSGFYTAGHPIDHERRNLGLEYALPITIGDNVWIGGGVHVMPGVTIGSDVVIGSGSIVTRDIPDHCVAAGNPCRVIRTITETDRAKDYDSLLPVLENDEEASAPKGEL